MSRMIVPPGRALSALLALGTLAAAGAWTSTLAQEPPPRVRVESEDCRCVDRDGNEIEHCTCFRMPDVSGITARAFTLREPRVRLGITITESRDAADESRGARIQSVLEDGPADEAGLQEDDIITAVDGKSLLVPLDEEAEEPVERSGSMAVQRLMTLLRDVEPDQEVRVDYLRDGEARSTTVTAKKLDDWGMSVVIPRWRSDTGEMAEAMAEMRGRLRELRIEGREPSLFELRVPDAPATPRAPRAAVRVGSPDFFFATSDACPGERAAGVWTAWSDTRCVAGVALEALNPKLGEYFGTSQGVLVTDVGEDSALGLEPGDVILDVGGREATDPDRVRRILSSYEDDEPITLRIMRQKREMSVQGSLGR